MWDIESRINQAVFPGLQGGPHNHAIAAIATAMKQATTPEFIAYQKQVVENAKKLCKCLQERGYKISTNGTDVHLILVDLRNSGLTGAKAEKILEDISIACNKNTVPGDKSALNPSGIRLGTPALTTRGVKENHIDDIAEYIHQGLLFILLSLFFLVHDLIGNFFFSGLALAKEVTAKSGPKMVDFKNTLETDPEIQKKVAKLRDDVETYSQQFSLPGVGEF